MSDNENFAEHDDITAIVSLADWLKATRETATEVLKLIATMEGRTEITPERELELAKCARTYRTVLNAEVRALESQLDLLKSSRGLHMERAEMWEADADKAMRVLKDARKMLNQQLKDKEQDNG